MPDEIGRCRVVIDRDRCMGSGMCMTYAPGTFVHDDEAKATIHDPAGDPMESILTAVEACPTRALSVVTESE